MANDQGEARAAIGAVLQRQSAAWAAGDADAFGSDALEDVVFTNIVGLFSVGKLSFNRQHAHIFSTFYKGSRMTQSVEHIVLIRPDVAIVNTLTEVEGGGPFPPNFPRHDGLVRTRLEQVMVCNDGSWRVAAFHNVAVAPGLSEGPPA